jgi:hypothetical protein
MLTVKFLFHFRSERIDAGAAGPGCGDAAGVWRGSDQAIDAAACGDELKIIASIEEPQLIAKILSHLGRRSRLSSLITILMCHGSFGS